MFLDFEPGQHTGHTPGGSTTGHRISAFRQFINVLGCGLAIPLYYLTTAHSRFPVTLDILITIALTELSRYVIEGQRMAFLSQ